MSSTGGVPRCSPNSQFRRLCRSSRSSEKKSSRRNLKFFLRLSKSTTSSSGRSPRSSLRPYPHLNSPFGREDFAEQKVIADACRPCQAACPMFEACLACLGLLERKYEPKIIEINKNVWCNLLQLCLNSFTHHCTITYLLTMTSWLTADVDRSAAVDES